MFNTRNCILTASAALPLVFAVFQPAVADDHEFTVNERVALPFPPGVDLQSQCGLVDDLQDVELYDGTLGVDTAYVVTNEPNTVQFQWMDEASIRSRLPDYVPGNISGVRWCTGTLYDDRHILTAGHCFDASDGSNGWLTPWRINDNGVSVLAEPEVLATAMVANFRYQINRDTGAEREPDVYPIAKLVEYRRGPDQLDYAIVELGRNSDGALPGDAYAAANVEVRNGTEDELLAIIQHPQGMPKKVEAGKLLAHQGRDLFYGDIDTHGGSSGSGIRDGSGTVIGVHTNGGCIPGVPDSANRGVSMVAISEVSDLF